MSNEWDETTGLYDTTEGIKLGVSGEAFARIHITPQGTVLAGNGLGPPTVDGLGLASQTDLDAHIGTTHGHPDLAAHDTLGLATQAEVDAQLAAAGDTLTGNLVLNDGGSLDVTTANYLRLISNGGSVLWLGKVSSIMFFRTNDGYLQNGSGSVTGVRFDSTGVAFNGNAPVAKAAAIASPTADVAALKTAVDAIRAALTAIGITA